jgi:polyisoprenoid-binding protein YceI
VKYLLAALLLSSPAFAATTFTNAPGTGNVEFLAVGKPSALKIHGNGAKPEAKLSLDGTQLKGAIEVDLDKLDTGIDLRTRHMKEKYLEVAQFPKATLTLADAPVDAGFAQSLTNSGEKKFRGKLSLHGKEKEVIGTYTAENGTVKAKFPLTLSDFGINLPKYLGITVADTVDVDVEVPLKK